MRVGEWSGTGENGRLHIQISLCDGTVAEELCFALDKFSGDFSWDSRRGELHIISDTWMENDSFLLELDSAIDSFNSGRSDDERVEILETRLVPEDLKGSPYSLQSRFQIKPYSQSEQSADTIFLEPDRSFGTGTHPSTHLVLHFLEFYLDNFPEKILDVGCGSGILSLFCARLGARKIVGIDICSHAAEVAQRNVELNDLENTISITDLSLDEIYGTFDLILANLTPSVFYRLQDDILRCSRQEGTRLIVSGLQGRQADEMAELLDRQGWAEEKRLSAGQWRALLFSLS